LTKEQFKNLYQQYGGAIRNYLYYRSGSTAIADDLTQETFIKIWEKQFKYDSKIKGLLYKIAGGLFLDYVRRHKLETEYIEEWKFKLKTTTEGDTSEQQQIQQKCEAALKILTEKERTVFLMNKKDGLTYRDIAECLNISMKAVEKRMGKALKKLKSNR